MDDWTPQPEQRPALMTVDETARLLRLSRAKTYMMASDGTLPVVRIGRSIRVHRAKLIEWLDRS